MTILIAGATGLIGRELVQQCHDEGITVHYLTTDKNKIEKSDNYKGFYWDPSQNEIDTTAFDGVAAIVNLAGAPVSQSWTKTHKNAILKSRVQTAEVLYNALKEIEHKVEHYISSSGISIYKSSLSKMYSEDEETVGDSFLAKTVVAWEAAADQISDLGIKVTKLRTGIVLHGSEGALPKMMKPIQMGIGAPLASGEQWQSWIHIEDMAGIFLHVVKNRLSGVYNGVAPAPITNKKMTQVIAFRLQKSLRMPKVPAFILKLMLGEMSDLVLESQLVSAKKIRESGYRFHYVNLEMAIADLL